MAKSRGTKRGRKKKRIAVHIQEAQRKRAASALSSDDVKATKLVVTTATGGKLRPGKRPRDSENLEVDDPARREKERVEASSYLSGWLSARKAKQGTAMGDDSVVTDVWKFNKKTQAWLLRHMFIENELAEYSFRTMCLYLEGLKGAARQRVLAEAQQMIEKHGPDEEEERPTTALPDADKQESATVTSSSTIINNSTTNSSGTKRREERNARPVKKKVRFEGGSSSDSESVDSTEPIPEDLVATSSSSSSDEENQEEVPNLTGKKREKARSAEAKQAKTEAKKRAANVAYDRALQVAEVLS
ncbi:unnamed protein product [Ascophyllum nodosum]